MGGFETKCRFRFSKALLPTHSATFGHTFLRDAKKVFSSWGTEGLGKGAAIKVSDSLQDPMWFASAGDKQDIRAFVARRLQA